MTEFVANQNTGVMFALTSLFFLSFLPIITNGRPFTISALDFALYFTLWELIFSLPLLFVEAKKTHQGLFEYEIDTKKRSKAVMVIMGTGVIFAITTFLYVVSFQNAGTVNAAIAMQTYPLFSIFIELIFQKKKKNRGELFFTLTLLIGIYYLGTSGTWLITNFSIWFAIALIVPILWSIAHIIVKETLANYSITPNQVLFIRVVTSSSILFIFSAIINGPVYVFANLFNSTVQFYAFLMGSFYYMELLFWFYSLKHIDVSVTSSISTPAPVFTSILSFFILKENVTSIQITSMIIAVVSLYGLLYFGKKKNGEYEKEMDVK